MSVDTWGGLVPQTSMGSHTIYTFLLHRRGQCLLLFLRRNISKRYDASRGFSARAWLPILFILTKINNNSSFRACYHSRKSHVFMHRTLSWSKLMAGAGDGRRVSTTEIDHSPLIGFERTFLDACWQLHDWLISKSMTFDDLDQEHRRNTLDLCDSPGRLLALFLFLPKSTSALGTPSYGIDCKAQN